MRVLLFCCVVFLFAQCESPEPAEKKKSGPVTSNELQRFFAHVFKDVKRIDPRPLDGDRFSMARQLSDRSLLTYFTPEDIHFMCMQYLSRHDKDFSEYFQGVELMGAQKADSLLDFALGMEEPEKNGFDAFTLPLFSRDKLTVLIHHRHLAGTYASSIKTVIYHWNGKRWEEADRLMSTHW